MLSSETTCVSALATSSWWQKAMLFVVSCCNTAVIWQALTHVCASHCFNLKGIHLNFMEEEVPLALVLEVLGWLLGAVVSVVWDTKSTKSLLAEAKWTLKNGSYSHFRFWSLAQVGESLTQSLEHLKLKWKSCHGYPGEAAYITVNE